MTDEPKDAESMVERVAMAIEEVGPVGCCNISRGQAREFARAAIAAMREPTAMQLLEGIDHSAMPYSTWQAMIDAALAGGRP